jgi:Zn finger protein HypA/HybF involved in hydrogenase expression
MNKLPQDIACRCDIKIKDHLEKITEIAPLGPCESCGAVLDKERKVEMRMIEYPYKHWRYRCASCGKYKNELTGEYDCDVKTANAICRQKWTIMNKQD